MLELGEQKKGQEKEHTEQGGQANRMNAQTRPFGNPGLGPVSFVISKQTGRMQGIGQKFQNVHLTCPGEQVDPANDFALNDSVGPIVQAIPKQSHGFGETATRLAVNPVHVEIDRRQFGRVLAP